ncbi:hypothetical protein FRB97_001321, partial [Tulasnella sp. 331]
GKDKVRVFRIVRNGDWHDVVEYTVCALLEGAALETSFTQADNAYVVATDSVKNTVNVLAKTSPHVLDPVLFALHIALHFVTTYKHITKSVVSIESFKWSRIAVDGKDHKHSFVRDGDEKEVIKVEVDASAGQEKVTGTVTSGLKDLLVLKSSGSAFEGFFHDEYTTLTPVSDRILSTAIEYEYTVPVKEDLTIAGLGALGEKLKFKEVAMNAKKVTLDLFATDESASVQTLAIVHTSALSVETSSREGQFKSYSRGRRQSNRDLGGDLLSRHVNKCHSGIPPPIRGKKAAAASHQAQQLAQQQQQQQQIQPNTVPSNLGLPHASTDVPCDQCLHLQYQCDLGAPCGKCLLRKAKCTYIAKISRLPGISPAIGDYPNNSNSNHIRRPSLPSLIQQQQHDYLFAARGPASNSFPYSTTQQPNNYDSGYSNDFQPNDTANGVPSGVPSYYDDPRLQQQFNTAGNERPSQYNPSDLGRFTSQQQQYIFGDNSPLPNTLPALVLADASGYVSDGSPDLKALGNYQQFRRNSLQLPLKGGTGYAGAPSGDIPYHFSTAYSSGGQQNQQQQAAYQYTSAQGQAQVESANNGMPFSYNNANPPNTSMFNQTGGMEANRQFDGARVNERLMATHHLGHHQQQQQQQQHPYSPQRQQPRGVINGYVFDDNSSVSDFGGSNNSGHPSPVPSTHSLSGASALSSTRSRRTSSPGSSMIDHVARFQPGTSATSSNGGSDGFVSSLQGAIPLPTPLQMPSFGGEGNVSGGSGAASTVGGSGVAGGTPATVSAGPTMFPPPYQSFDNMRLEEASFAAAAKNAGNGGQQANNNINNINGVGGMMYNGMNVLSAGGKERAINELKDFWSAFISEPLTGGTPGAGSHTLMKQRSTPSLKTPIPMSSERSSMLGAGFNNNSNSEIGSPTPRTLYPNGGISSMLGMNLHGGSNNGGSSLNPNNQRRVSTLDKVGGVTQHQQQQQQPQQPQPQPQRIGGTTSTEDEASLKSYQEACLKRETPMLRLIPRAKSHAPGGSTATSPQAKHAGSSASPPEAPVPALPVCSSPPPQLSSKDSNDSNSSATTLRGIQTLGSFAAPYAPDSKKGRDWSSQFQRGGSSVNNSDDVIMRSGVSNNYNNHNVTSHSRTQSLVDPVTTTNATVASRPSYKRLPSQTLGPEHSKKQAIAMTTAYAEEDDMENDSYNDDRGPFRMPTSVAQPGYGINSVIGMSGGGAHAAWQRQRSLSSPTTMRTFDWQSIGSTAAGAGR